MTEHLVTKRDELVVRFNEIVQELQQKTIEMHTLKGAISAYNDMVSPESEEVEVDDEG